MTIFLLIRHGTTDMLGRILAGWMPGVHLNEKGKREAAELAERLAPLSLAALYCSPLDRALETAAPLASRKGLPVQVCEGVGEIRFGEWTGMDFPSLNASSVWKRFNEFRSGTRIPGGEIIGEVQARMVAEMERIQGLHPDGMVAVVSHGDVIKAAIAYYVGIPLDLMRRIEIGPASVSSIAIDAYGPVLLCVNHTEGIPLRRG
ncbi:MAG: histidine phosphatase family protein [Alphaproteobacteria bacterium]|uniref:Histidine phosphatase family protein n=1 Tax=Candidatus Nitrobium versatile TaxID=2884831 RepID=A0A953LXT6_9BACT|nr:histidine phosphatase family protein [Candidatus Nitrobium versatile]